MRFLATLLLFSSMLVGQTCPPTGVAPKITSSPAVTFNEDKPGTFTVTATGTPAPTITISGTLPAGVAVSGATISGTPSVSGVFPLSVHAANAIAPDADQQFTLTVEAAPTGGYWLPSLVASWQWQLESAPSASKLLKVDVYDVDGDDASAALVAAMHKQNTHAICYVDAGTYENFRDDKGSFPKEVLGSKVNGWAGEQWLDIRQIDKLAPIMTARFQSCKDKGFDAVEPDNIDGYTNKTGFPLTYADQLAYNKWIANTVHSLGLSVALKNDGDQVKDLLAYFDFAIEEECTLYGECGIYAPFVTNNKAVFSAEYSNETTASKACPTLNKANFNGAVFDLDLTGKRTACR